MVAPNLPRMGLGMAALGRPGYINLNRQSVFGSESRTIERMREQAFLCLDALFQQQSSTPWIDCARSYGLSEQFVGEYLKDRKIDPSQVVVSSKWGYTYVADFQVSLQADAPHELKDHSKANFLKQVEETAEHLGDYLDLYQIHSATFESGILTDQETHEALYECKKARGWKLGLSVSSPKQDEIIRAALQIQVNGERLFDSVQCTFNVLEQRPGKALQEVAEAGMDIIIKEGMCVLPHVCQASNVVSRSRQRSRLAASSCSQIQSTTRLCTRCSLSGMHTRTAFCSSCLVRCSDTRARGIQLEGIGLANERPVGRNHASNMYA